MFKRLLISWFGKLMFAYEQSKLNVLYKSPNVSIAGGLKIEEYFSVNFPHEHYIIKLGQNVHFKKYCHLMVFNNGRLEIGNDVFFNNYCSVNCLESISIGANTLFGEGVKIYDHNHAYRFADEQIVVEKASFKTAPVNIGANCWIGSNVTILKGVTIGNNVIIGANNLIYQSVGDNIIIKAKADQVIENQKFST